MPRRRPNLTIEVVPYPVEDYQEQLDAALDILADALAVQFIEKARQQVAEELCVDPDSLLSRKARLTAGLGEAQLPPEPKRPRRRKPRAG